MRIENLVGDSGENWTICVGHIDAVTFKTAIKDNSGCNLNSFTDDDISFEYWIENPDGTWLSSNKFDPKALPVTVMEW